MPGSTPGAEEYYRWVDASGRVHIVSSFESVPPERRASAERIVLERGPASTQAEPPPLARWFEHGWLALGVVCAIAVLLAWRSLPRGWRWLPKLAAFALVGTLLAGLYFGALRRATTSADGAAVASPSAIIQDAERAVEKMRQRQSARDAELRRIEAETK